TTLGLDPLTHRDFGTTNSNIFIEYTPEQRLKFGNFFLGPACEGLQPFASEISVLRGLNMRTDIQHEPMNDFWVQLSTEPTALLIRLADRLVLGFATNAQMSNASDFMPILLSNQESTEMSDLDWKAIQAANPESGVEAVKKREERLLE